MGSPLSAVSCPGVFPGKESLARLCWDRRDLPWELLH